MAVLKSRNREVTLRPPPESFAVLVFGMPKHCDRFEVIRDHLLPAVAEYHGIELRAIWPLRLSIISCGMSITFGGIDEIPLTNVPCPCGDTLHWLLYWWETTDEV